MAQSKGRSRRPRSASKVEDDSRQPVDEVHAIKFARPARQSAWDHSLWKLALSGMAFGDCKYAAELLERGEPIPIQAAQVLARALLGDNRLPFRLELIANPKPGQKRSGRWPENNSWRDANLAMKMIQAMANGDTYAKAAERVAERYRFSERLVKLAYSKHKELGTQLAEVKNAKKVFDELIAKREKQPPVSPWMLKGDSDPRKRG